MRKVGVGHLPQSWVARTETAKEGDSGSLVQIKDKGQSWHQRPWRQDPLSGATGNNGFME